MYNEWVKSWTLKNWVKIICSGKSEHFLPHMRHLYNIPGLFIHIKSRGWLSQYKFVKMASSQLSNAEGGGGGYTLKLVLLSGTSIFRVWTSRFKYIFVPIYIIKLRKKALNFDIWILRMSVQKKSITQMHILEHENNN